MRWSWPRRHREVDPDAIAAVHDAQRKLVEADAQLAHAKRIGAEGQALRRRNHFTEAAVAAIQQYGSRP